MTRGPHEPRLPEFAGSARVSRPFFLWGLLLGAVAGVLGGHPLFMLIYHLHEYLDRQAPSLDLGGAILHSFSPHAWPLILLFSLAGALFGGVLGGLYQHLEKNRLAYQAHLRSLAAELSLVEERERRRLATELHEHIGQVLAFARIKLGMLSAGSVPPDVLLALKEIREHIDHSIQYTRSLTFELSPPVLYELGFEAAIEWLANQIRATGDIRVEIQRPPSPLPLTEEARVLLFLVVRELLTNVAKHAQASQVKISLGLEGDELRIQVDDDGVGFDAPHTGGGFGLFSIRERLGRIGGSLKVRSKVGQGTAVTVTIPLPLAEPTAGKPGQARSA